MSETYFRQTCRRARMLLGSRSDGRPGLLFDHGAYALHPEVTVDWALFQLLAGGGRGRRAEDSADLRSALELVRGEPFEDCDYRWVDQMQVQYMRGCIVDMADRLAHAADDPVVAGWAACRGLLADPYAEPLYRSLMRACNAAGHRRMVKETYALCVQALAGLGLEPDRETVALAELTGGGDSSWLQGMRGPEGGGRS